MKVKCVYNKFMDVPESIFSSSEFNSEAGRRAEFSLRIGREYTVYGATIRDNCIWYYLCREHFTYYPRWYPSPFFDVIDSRISRHWVYSYKKLDNYGEAYPILTFSEWANDHPDFYDRLTDEEEEEVEIFSTYKELMDLEFPDSSVLDIAQIGDDEWLICSLCIDAWQCSNGKDALVRCPKCQKALNNPRYKNEWPHL